MGTLSLFGEEWTRGDYVRNLSFNPRGNFLIPAISGQI
jgi:hypothetical protein